MAKINAVRVLDADIPLSRKLYPYDICLLECDRLHNAIGLWVEREDGDYDSILPDADLAGWIMLDSPVGRRILNLVEDKNGSRNFCFRKPIQWEIDS